MRTFATAINRVDGRVQLPAIEYLQKNYGVDFVDMITEPGPVSLLSGKSQPGITTNILRRCQLSVARHNPRIIAIEVIGLWVNNRWQPLP